MRWGYPQGSECTGLKSPYVERNFIYDILDERVDACIDSVYINVSSYVDNSRLK